MRFFAKSCGLWITVSVIVVLLGIEVGFSFWKWEWLREDTVSAAIRNVGLVMAATIAIPLAVWRGYVAHKQANAAQEQVEKAQQQVEASQRQADTAQQGLRNERYQKGAEMLGSEVPSVRMGGIYALQRLAEEYPEEYHIQIMRLFCAFVRYPTRDKVYEDQIKNEDLAPLAREDVEAAMQAIGNRDEARIALERKAEFYLELLNSNLSRMHLPETNLSHAIFIEANLYEAMLTEANLSDTDLESANLSDANLRGANLSKAVLQDANISGAKFGGVEYFTQKQLNQARAGIFNRPKLEGALDAETGKELKWEGGQGLPL